MLYAFKGKFVWFGEAFEAERFKLWFEYEASCKALRRALNKGFYYAVLDAHKAKEKAGACFLNFCKPHLDRKNIEFNLLSRSDQELFLAIHSLSEEKVQAKSIHYNTPYPICVDSVVL